MAEGVLRNTKQLANFLLAGIGYKLVSIDRPTRDFRQFFDHLKRHGFVPRTVLDVGAASGTRSLHDAFSQARFVLVEALQEFEPALRALAARLPNCEVHMVAVGAVPGKITLNLHDDPYGSFVGEAREDAPTHGQRRIKIVTLDEILAANPPACPALAKFDIQGHEIEALKGLERYFNHFDVFIIETSLHITSSSPPDLYTIVTFMRDRGYSVFDLLDGLVRPLDGDLAQIDLVFVRDDGPFRRSAGKWRSR
jgi:FkbM family methyltransferase